MEPRIHGNNKQDFQAGPLKASLPEFHCGPLSSRREWNGNGSMVAFVVSANIKRRHLNASQKACVAVEMIPLLAKEAAERRKATQGRPKKLGVGHQNSSESLSVR